MEGATNWFGITAFRSLGEHAAQSLRKGDRVFVHGRLKFREWETPEKNGTSAEIEADALGHDLRWGVSRFEKRSGGDAARGAAGSAAGSGSGEGSATGGSGERTHEPERSGSDGVAQTAWTSPAVEPEEANGFGERLAA